MLGHIFSSSQENCLQSIGKWMMQEKKSVVDTTKAGMGYVATNYSEMAEDSIAILRAGTRVFNLYRLGQREGNPLQNEPFDENHPVNRASVIATQVLGIAVLAAGTCVGILATPLSISVGLTALSYGASALFYGARAIYSVAAAIFGGAGIGYCFFEIINTVGGVAGYIFSCFAAIPGAGVVVTGLVHLGGRSFFASLGGVGASLLIEDRIQNVRITSCFRRFIDMMVIANGVRQVLSLGVRLTGIFACVYAFSWNLGVAQQLVASGNMMVALKSAAFSVPLAFVAKEIYTTGRELRGSGLTEVPVVDIVHKLLVMSMKIAALSTTWLAFRWNIWTVQLLLSGSVYKTLFVGSITVPTALLAYDLHHISREINQERNYARALWRRGLELLRFTWDTAIYDEPSWRPVALDQTYLMRHITGALFLGLNQLRHLARSEHPEPPEAPEVGVQRRGLSVSLAAITGLALFGILGAMAMMTAVEYARSRQRRYTRALNIVQPVGPQTGNEQIPEILDIPHNDGENRRVSDGDDTATSQLNETSSNDGENGHVSDGDASDGDDTATSQLNETSSNDGENRHVSDSDDAATFQSNKPPSIVMSVEEGKVGTSPAEKPSGVLGVLEKIIFSNWMADPWMDDENDGENRHVSDSDDAATFQSNKPPSIVMSVEEGKVGTAPAEKLSGVLGVLEKFIFSNWMADPWMDDEDDSYTK